VERALPLGHRKLELLDHHFLAAVVWELEVVCAGHCRGEVDVRYMAKLWRLSHHRQLRVQRLESSHRQPRAPRDKLQKLPLLRWLELAHDFNQPSDGRAVIGVPVVGLDAFAQGFAEKEKKKFKLISAMSKTHAAKKEREVCITFLVPDFV